MTHAEGAGDALVAIQGRLDQMGLRFHVMETGFDAMFQTLQLHGAMLRVHGDHFGRLEAKLVEHGAMLEEHGRRFDQVDVKLAEHDARFDRVDARFDQVDARFDQVDEALQKILARLDAPRP